jgi:hypothetical protein
LCLNEQTKIKTDEYIIWRQNGKLHREDGPAAIWKNGYMVWYLIQCDVNHTFLSDMKNDKKYRVKEMTIIRFLCYSNKEII